MPKLTTKQKRFADKYLETGNGTQSALASYDTTSPKTASVIAVENLAKPSVRDYIESQAPAAMSRIVELSITAENETVKLNANKDILDRAGYKPVEKSMTLNLNADTKDLANPKLAEVKQRYEEELRKQLEQ
jgi:phage terminase small subunit